MKMMKLIAVFLVGVLALSGCSSKSQDSGDYQNKEEHVEMRPSIGGIHLGDNQDRVNEILGNV